MMIRWPGKIKAGEISNTIISQEDWMPTLVAAAGEPNVKQKLMEGYTANGRQFRIHPDGDNFVPYLTGQVKEGPRKSIFYFGQGGELNAIRVQDWKIHFATVTGNIATGVRQVPGWPLVINLKADPYERMWQEGTMNYWRWYGDNMWTFVPAQEYIQQFLATIPKFPFQAGSSLNAAGVNYQSLQAQEVLKKLETMSLPRN